MHLPQWGLRTSFLISVSIAAPWLAAALIATFRRQLRIFGSIATLVSILACTALVWRAPSRKGHMRTR